MMRLLGRVCPVTTVGVVVALLAIITPIEARQLQRRGRVTDAESGEPVSAATVRLVATGEDGQASAGTVLATSRTKPDGSFVLALGNVRGVFEVAARGYATRRLPWPSGRIPEEIMLERGARLDARVVDQSGAPVSALLTIQTFHPGNIVTSAIDAPSGIAEYVDAPSGPTILIARSPGFAPATTRLHVAAGKSYTVPDLVLRPAAAVSGFVVDASGVARPNARIVASYGPEWPNATTLGVTTK